MPRKKTRRQLEDEIGQALKSKNKSFIARYWSTDGRPMLGGVMRSESSPWSHREDAESYLAAVIENNAGVSRAVSGEVVESDKPAKIKRHCEGAPAQAVGAICPRCRKKVT